MEVISKYGANYLICNPLEYNPKKEILFFGEKKIIPGQKIRKIGDKKRTSFEANDDSFFCYDGTLNILGIKYCVLSSSWEDIPGEFIYRYAFGMANTNKPTFLFNSSNRKGSGADINCRVVELIN